MKGAQRRKWWAIYGACAAGFCVLLLTATALLLPALDAAGCLVQKLRYTSICTDCGEQQSEVFYSVIGMEVARTKQVLPLSAFTALTRENRVSCEHPTVLIGRSAFVVTKSLDLEGGRIGAPFGWRFEGVQLEKTLKGFEKMRPAEVLASMDRVVRESGE